MARRRHTPAVRLAVEGGGKVKTELTSVGDSGERSLKRVETASGRASRELTHLMDRGQDAAAGHPRH